LRAARRRGCAADAEPGRRHGGADQQALTGVADLGGHGLIQAPAGTTAEGVQVGALPGDGSVASLDTLSLRNTGTAAQLGQ